MFGTKTFTRMLQDWAAAAQGACATLLDFAVGAILRAISEAQGGSGLWLQSLILQLLSTTRLATSSGNAVDTFCADFMPVVPGTNSPRLPAAPASGSVTFARYTPTNTAIIPVSALIQTADGTQTFEVVADTTQSAYSSLLNAYVIAASVTSCTATVQDAVGGTGGNISAGTLTVLQSGISGVDTVTNPSAFSNGVNAESDAALKARFANYLASLSKGTVPAIEYAITALNQNLQVTIVSQPLYTPNVLVTVDDGSGDIPGALVTAALAAATAVVAAGISISVLAATKITANVNMTITVATGYTAATVEGQVATAIEDFIDGVGLGNPVSYFALPGVALAVPGCAEVDPSTYTLNSSTGDIVPTAQQTVKSGTVSIG